MRASIVISERSGVRYLHFGSRWIQGAMRLQRPWALELDYTRVMMAPLVLRPEPDWPREVLLVGLGAASQLRFLYRHRPGARFTAVEIDERVIATAYRSFKLPEDRGRESEREDGGALALPAARQRGIGRRRRNGRAARIARARFGSLFGVGRAAARGAWRPRDGAARLRERKHDRARLARRRSRARPARMVRLRAVA